MKRIFFGGNGLRAGWRFAAFFALLFVSLYLLSDAFDPLAAALHVSERTITAKLVLLNDGALYLPGVLIATGVAAFLERRRIDSYGLPLSQAFGIRYVQGVVLGVLAAMAIAVAMIALGGMVIHGVALHGRNVLVQPLFYALAMIVVGVTEEYLFRGYMLQTLARGIGFWPAAVLTSLLFVLAHVGKTGENVVDYASLFCFGLVACFTVARTGSLWMAAGLHSAFDFMQLFVIGTPNGSMIPQGRLLDASFPGPAWINGGPLGTEASYFTIPALLLIALLVTKITPQRVPPAESP